MAWVDGQPYVLEFNRLFGNRGIPDLPRRVGAAMRAYLLGESESPPDDSPAPMTRSA